MPYGDGYQVDSTYFMTCINCGNIRPCPSEHFLDRMAVYCETCKAAYRKTYDDALRATQAALASTRQAEIDAGTRVEPPDNTEESK